ncbi:hypothetical protein [Flavobacterium laiguense]|uniref:Uncharacterized protein n=1 Tax=Flavobacterium laiguense TaxID=2169409 RepID=A0A2U1JUT7_9FLAO|nr:hypothetical protein [Flavobacterium laiguense]PWA08966.1 hypothetical protein DB891_09960 [Flavobacterium laiguense]
MTETCQNCAFFDDSKHKNNARTKDAGICTKWVQIAFKKETCKQHFLNTNLSEKDVFSVTAVSRQQTDNVQLNLF